MSSGSYSMADGNSQQFGYANRYCLKDGLACLQYHQTAAC
jgi:hypothetical protein